MPTCLGCYLFGRKNRRLGIERIKNGLYKQHIHTTFYQGLHLLFVCGHEIIERSSTKHRIFHPWTHRGSFVCRSDRAGNETGLVWREPGKLIGRFTGQLCGCQIDLGRQRTHSIILHGDAGCIECICLNDVSSCFKIFPVYLSNHVGAREGEQVVIPFQQSLRVFEPLTPEIGFGEFITLYHCTHRTIEYQDTIG